MKISQENNGTLTLLVKIDVEQTDYQPKVDKELKHKRKTMTVPGFRPGQVPMGMVRKMYEIPLKANIIESLISDELAKYINDNKINVLLSPMTNDEKTPNADFEKDSNFTFYFDIACQPEFEIDLKKEKMNIFEVEPTEEAINRYIETSRRKFGKYETPEQIGEGDTVYGHLVELQEDSQKKESGIDIHSTLYMDNIALKTIKDKFIGKKKDDTITFKPAKAIKDITQLATFLHKTEEEAKDFAAECQFTVSSIQKIIPAELNEEFFNQVYPNKNIKDEKGFRDATREFLIDAYKRDSEQYFFNNAIEEIVKNVKFDLPNEFLKRWLVSSAKEEKDKKNYEEHFDNYLTEIRWQIIKTKISEQNNLNVTSDDVLSYIKTVLLPSYFPIMPGETEEQKKERELSMDTIARNMLSEKEGIEKIRSQLLDTKILDLFKKEMHITTKKINIDDFVKEILSKDEPEKPKTKKKTTKSEKIDETKDQPSLF